MNLDQLPILTTSLVLTATFAYVWRRSGERYLLVWTMAAAIWAVRYGMGVLTPQTGGFRSTWVSELFVVARLSLFLWGGALMSGTRMPRWWWPLAGSALVVALTLQDDAGLDVPALVFYTAMLGGVGWLAARVAEHEGIPRFERWVIAGALLAYGLNMQLVPWAGFVIPWYSPWGPFVTAVAQLTLALAILAAYFRNAEAEIARSHARTASALGALLGEHVDVCSRCRAVKSDEGSWQALERHVASRAGLRFSHGICPTCAERHYGDLLADPSGS